MCYAANARRDCNNKTNKQTNKQAGVLPSESQLHSHRTHTSFDLKGTHKLTRDMSFAWVRTYLCLLGCMQCARWTVHRLQTQATQPLLSPYKSLTHVGA